jgi:hypothetical protein
MLVNSVVIYTDGMYPCAKLNYARAQYTTWSSCVILYVSACVCGKFKLCGLQWPLFLFYFVLLPSSTCLFTVGVDGFDFSLDHTQTHTTVGRTPLDEGSVRRRDLYLTTQTLTRDRHACPRWDSNLRSQ